MADTRRCWKCNTSYPADTAICAKCGVNLVTGEQVGGAPVADEAEPREAGPLLRWLGDTLPGLFRFRIIVAALVVSLAAAFVFWLAFVFLLAAPLSAFPIGAFSLIMYGQALAWLITGEFTLMHVAMTDFRGKDWSNFVLLLFLPIVLAFVCLRHATKAQEAAEMGTSAPAEEEEEEPAPAEAEYVISSVTPGLGQFSFGGTRSAPALDADGNFYFAESSSHRVCKLSPATGAVTVIAGTGEQGTPKDGTPAAKAELSRPCSVAVDRKGNVYITEGYYVRKVDATGTISTVVAGRPGSHTGDGGPARAAGIPRGIKLCTDASGNLYLLDSDGARVRKVDMATGIINTVAGTGAHVYAGDGGPATLAGLRAPQGIAVDAKGNLLIADTRNHRIRRVDAVSGRIETIAGIGEGGYKGVGGPAKAARIGDPWSVTADPQGNVFFVASNNRVYKIDAATGALTVAAGTGQEGEPGKDGPATGAALDGLASVVADAKGTIFLGERGNHVIRKLERAKK